MGVPSGHGTMARADNVPMIARRMRTSIALCDSFFCIGDTLFDSIVSDISGISGFGVDTGGLVTSVTFYRATNAEVRWMRWEHPSARAFERG